METLSIKELKQRVAQARSRLASWEERLAAAEGKQADAPKKTFRQQLHEAAQALAAAESKGLRAHLSARDVAPRSLSDHISETELREIA